ncbi:hypothetical protein BC831DRAFT_484073 [Entophlyctis helioformis]|nr:hypothetical protein BC831DRAFT_484073 [Entophlyctis helioformis]
MASPAYAKSPVILERRQTTPAVSAPEQQPSDRLLSSASPDLTPAGTTVSASPLATTAAQEPVISASTPPRSIATGTAPSDPPSLPPQATEQHLKRLFSTLFQRTSPVAIKLLDDQLRFQPDQAFRVLSDFPGCFIVGVLGRKGVGKSTVLSSFVPPAANPFNVARPAASTAVDAAVELPIPTASDAHEHEPHHTTAQISQLHRKQRQNQRKQQQAQQQQQQHNETRGVDMYVTRERLVLLDTQAVLSTSIQDRARQPPDIFPDASAFTAAQQLRPETLAEVESIKTTLFLLSVCHVVLLVSDSPRDEELWRLVRKVESIRARMAETQQPQSSKSASANASRPHGSSSMAGSSHQPVILHIANKSKAGVFADQIQAAMRVSFKSAFNDSVLDTAGLFAQSTWAVNARTYIQSAPLRADIAADDAPSDSAAGDIDDVLALFDAQESTQSKTNKRRGKKTRSVQLQALQQQPRHADLSTADRLAAMDANVFCLPQMDAPDTALDQSYDDLLDELDAGCSLVSRAGHGMPARYSTLARQLRDAVLGIPRFAMQHHASPAEPGPRATASMAATPRRQFLVSERDWIKSSARIWDAIRKTDIGPEYLATAGGSAAMGTSIGAARERGGGGDFQRRDNRLSSG